MLCKVARSRRGMVKRLVGSICHERFPRGMGGDFSPVASRMAEGLMLASARFCVVHWMQVGNWATSYRG